jgi:hypothetical protein
VIASKEHFYTEFSVIYGGFLNKFTMNRESSKEKRVFVLQKWWQHDHNYRDVVDLLVKIRDL